MYYQGFEYSKLGIIYSESMFTLPVIFRSYNYLDIKISIRAHLHVSNFNQAYNKKPTRSKAFLKIY